MSKITYMTGDLIASGETIIVHGSNAQNVMGRGIALAIKQRLPFAYKAYGEAFHKHGLALGDVIWAFNPNLDETPRIVGNAITQEYWQEDKEVDGRNADYLAIRFALRAVESFVRLTQMPTLDIIGIGSENTKGLIEPVKTVGFPLIGCGLAKGKWSVVSRIIEEESKSYTPVVYLLDGKIPED